MLMKTIKNDRKLVLFDLDRTLFDTDHFINLLRVKLANLARKDEQVLKQLENRYQKLFGKLTFDPLHYSEFLSREFKISSSDLFRLFTDDKKLYSESLFDETIPILKFFKKNKYQAGIFSEGNIGFQKMKINYSGLFSHLIDSNIYVFENKLTLASIESLPSDAVIVDDKQGVVDQLVGHGIQSIWINRASRQKHDVAQTIFSLKELEDLLQ